MPKLSFQKDEVVSGKTPFSAKGPFYTTRSISVKGPFCRNIYF